MLSGGGMEICPSYLSDPKQERLRFCGRKGDKVVTKKFQKQTLIERDASFFGPVIEIGKILKNKKQNYSLKFPTEDLELHQTHSYCPADSVIRGRLDCLHQYKYRHLNMNKCKLKSKERIHPDTPFENTF